MSPDPVEADEPRRRRRRQRREGDRAQQAADPAAARPRRPRRHAEVRVDDARPVLERASARETAARVALGEVAARFLEQAYGIRLVSHTVSIGTAAVAEARRCRPPTTSSASTPTRSAPSTPMHRPAMVAEVDAARKDGDTLGGVVEVLAYGLPPGPGLARPLGPPARRAARRRPDGHPGDQGRRGRRRLPAPRAAAARSPTTRWSVASTASSAVAPGRAGGTEGGMSTGGCSGARRDEADLHRAARAGDRRRRDRRARPRHPPALRRLRRPGGRRRRRGDGRPRASRRPAWRSSAATRSPRRPATTRPTSPRSPPAHMVTAD